MRAILVTVMLLLVVIAIYNTTIGGDNGTKRQLQRVDGHLTESILATDP